MDVGRARRIIFEWSFAYPLFGFLVIALKADFLLFSVGRIRYTARSLP